MPHVLQHFIAGPRAGAGGVRGLSDSPGSSEEDEGAVARERREPRVLTGRLTDARRCRAWTICSRLGEPVRRVGRMGMVNADSVYFATPADHLSYETP